MLPKCAFKRRSDVIRVLGVVDDILMIVIDGTVGNLVQEIFNLRVGFIQLLCLQKLYKQEADKEDNGKKNNRWKNT